MTADHPDVESPFGADVWNVLARHLAGECPPDEAERVRRWLAEDPRRAAWLSALSRGAERLAPPLPTTMEVEAALQGVKARYGDRPVLPLDGAGAEQPRRRRRTIGLRAAAAVALIAGATLVWQLTARSGRGPAVAVGREHATGVGVLDSIHLPDGSLAVLGPASQLTVERGYDQEDREIELAGQAMFDVRHDDARPFRVRAGGTVIQDLGTTFIVRSDDAGVRVAVTLGSVVVQDTGQTPAADRRAVLRAGDRATVEPGGRATVERGAVTDDDVSWTRGRLVFANAPLAHVRAELRRWYGIDLRADSSLAARHLTASFTGEPVDEVLRVVALALRATVERRDSTALLRVP